MSTHRPMRTLVSAILTGALAAVSPGAAALGADTSDIPGVPYPGPVATGRLGGATYDVVYWLDVAPGSVILASLTGSSGTDFDLYVFDGSATTVVTNRGVIARSVGPTSTESLSYATPIGGRFYIDLNSATPAVGTYTLVVQVIPDRPAIATLMLGAGRSRTNNTTVSATLLASGSLSGPAQMAFSGDGTTWQPWLPYQAVTSWTFPAGDGTKTLWAKVMNAAGVVSTPVAATIILDTQPPTVSVVDPAVNQDLVGARPTITVTFSKPIDPSTWTNSGLLVQTPVGVLVPGLLRVVAPVTGMFTPTEDLVVGGVYVITVGAVRDGAGNLVASIGSWVATDRPVPTVTMRASPPVVDRGAAALLAGRLTAPTGLASLTLEARPLGALATVVLGSVPIAADGSFSTRVTPSSTTEYRLQVPASGGFGAGSVAAVVSVRRVVRLNWSPSVAHAGRVGSRVTLIGSVGPAAAGLAVAFRLERWNAVSRSWQLVATFTRRTDAAGRASLTWLLSTGALYRWRATAGSTPEFATAASPWVRWSVTR
jgi:hypothetical protein